MKTHFIFYLIFAALGASPVLSQETNVDLWGPTMNDFQMSISLENGKSDVPLGQPVILKARIQNLSNNRTVYIHEFNQKIMDGSYAFSITSPSGSNISPKINGWIMGSGGTYAIGPGQIHEAELNLSLVCKFETVGKYKVVATKEIKDLSAFLASSQNKHSIPPFKVISNPLYIKVVQRHPKEN
jgi:hypothetical protein